MKFIKMIRHSSIILLACHWLAGCATLNPHTAPAVDQDMTWNQRQQTLTRIESWNINGSIAIHSLKSSESASLQWQQTKKNYTILLFGPLGASAIKLSGMPGSVTLQTANGKIVKAMSPEALLASQTGWRLPVSNLYYWIRGLPAPRSNAFKQFDAYHHLMSLKQQGWSIRYLHYVSFNQVDVPSKIYLDNPQLNVKIIINQWHF